MYEYFHQLLVNHTEFAWGFGLGLVLLLVTWISSLGKHGEMRREVRRLREHLHTQMDITSKGNATMRAELESLKTQNENLRVAVKDWQQKPGRAELRMLSVYDRAVRIMNQKAPGFAPAWESALRESENEVESSENGMSAMLRRAFRPLAALGPGGAAATKDDKAQGTTGYEEASHPSNAPD